MLEMDDLLGSSTGCLQPGMGIGDFTVMEFLGSGALGETYLAGDAEGSENTVIRLLSFQKNTPKALKKPVAALRDALTGVANRHVLHLRDTEIDDYFFWAAFRRSDRVPLSFLMRERFAAGEGPLGEAEVRRVVFQVLLGLHALHSAGVVHGGIKPAHCFVDEEFRTEIADAGLMPLVGFPGHFGRSGNDEESSSDIPGFTPNPVSMVETTVFAAPETTYLSRQSVAGDLYSTAYLTWYLLTGYIRAGASLFQVLTDEQRETWGPWILRAMAFQPEERFGDAEEMLAAMPGVEAV